MTHKRSKREMNGRMLLRAIRTTGKNDLFNIHKEITGVKKKTTPKEF